MSIPSIDSNYKNIDLLKQVYDGLLKKWFSITEHREYIEEYWNSLGQEKETSDYYIKYYYENVLKNFYGDESDGMDDRVNKYICFFVTPNNVYEDYRDEFCDACNESKLIDCEDCDERSFYCDVCGDVGFVECPFCNESDPITSFLVGAVSWYSFKNPYTDEINNAMFVDSILYFGCYEFLDTYGSNDINISSPLNQNEVSDDVNSAQIWTQLSQIEEIKELVSDADFNTSYYGLINSYSDLLKRIEVTSGIKISMGFQSYKGSGVKF